jgi:4-amino-4-deoxy-L-arabinose transferase-like glycosyltransferase
MNGTAMTQQASVEEAIAPEASRAAALKQVAPLLLIVACACLMFFANLGNYPLFNPDEALYAEPAREMLDTGEYVTTLLNYVVRFTKPPLCIWAMAGCYKIFGVSEFAARFPGALSGVLLVIATYLFAQRYLSRASAVVAASSLLTAPLFIGTAREAITDMPLSFFIAGGLMAFYHSFAARSAGFLWLAYVLTGLAVMTKGPVGLILPVAVIGCFHLLRREIIEAWHWYKPIIGLLIVAVISVPWFAIEIAITKGAYYNEFLVRENFQRFTSVVDHKGAWWYHIAAMLGGFLPWSVFVPQAWFKAINDWRLKRAESEPVLIFASLWSLIVLAFFSASVSKLIPYTLPAFPALALLIAHEFERCRQDGKLAPLAVPLVVLTAGSSAGVAFGPLLLTRLRDLPPDLPGLITSILWVLLAILLTALIAVSLRCIRLSAGILAGATFAAYLFFGPQLLGVLSREWEAPLPVFSAYAEHSSWPVFVYDMRKPSVPFYLHRKVILPTGREDLESRLAAEPCAFVMSRSLNRAYFEGFKGCKIIASQGRFLFVDWRRPVADQH